MRGMDRPFVIQKHTGSGPDHYDLMISLGKSLATWQVLTLPGEIAIGQSTSARRLADHRLEYLTYEGPVSNERGEVSIAAAGQCELLSESEGRWEFVLASLQWKYRFELTRDEHTDDAWTLRRLN